MENENIAEEPTVPYNQSLDFQQVWRMFQETDKQFKETDRRIRELDRLFTTQWGKLVESLVEGDLIKLLKEREIQVESIIPRRRGNKDGQNYEFDLIAINGSEMVIVEVKTTLRPQDIDDFNEKLWKAKAFMPEYKDWIIYGAVAFITADGSSDRMAQNKGFFVIRATGNSSSIVNEPGFKPKAF
jgi:Holliday junction resolvase-like predicted endonuclease